MHDLELNQLVEKATNYVVRKFYGGYVNQLKEDVSSHIRLALTKQINSEKPTSYAWMVQVGRRAAADSLEYYKKKVSSVSSLSSLTEEPVDVTSGSIFFPSSIKDVDNLLTFEDILRELTPTERKYYVGIMLGFSSREIADSLNMRLSNLNYHLNYHRKKRMESQLGEY